MQRNRRAMTLPKTLCAALRRHFSTKPAAPSFSNIPYKHRLLAIKRAQHALADYFHARRSLPYSLATLIAQNSLFSLSNLTSRILRISAHGFYVRFARFLRFRPINEFEFLFESIGLHYPEIPAILPHNKFFLDEDRTVLDAACALFGFGFPWTMLGVLFREQPAIFREAPSELNSRLDGLKRCGFSQISVICVCLNFPRVLSGGIDAEFLDGVKRDLSEFCDVEYELDFNFCYQMCRKFRLFYRLGLEKGEVGTLMSKKRGLFLEFSDEVFTQKAKYFCGFGVEKQDVGLLLVRHPEILRLDLCRPVISVVGLLKHVGLGADELNRVVDQFPHVLGRNRMANLPSVMRALDLHEWFFRRIMNDCQLLASYCLNSPDEDVDEDFGKQMEAILVSRPHTRTMNKLKFLHGIGYGENALTVEVLSKLHGTDQQLQERFNYLLQMGVEFSKLCLMIRTAPKILNQKPETLQQKVEFLCGEIGSPLKYLDVFPALLCFDLEERMKPRYRFHMWLVEKGLCSRDYSIPRIIATSEKNFVASIFRIHPAAPKHWFETFLSRTPAHH